MTFIFGKSLYHKSSKEKADALLEGFLKKCSTDEEKNIFTNTLMCPFDMELYQFLSSHDLSSENIQYISKNFDITNEVIAQKWREYIGNDYIQCVGEGIIDYNIIFELSKEFLKNLNDDAKMPKVS